mmetsp:Transcript_40012/g.128316  ORF Transcript_40012/g.128316 Transcript_40012/m.128316 type:complete len:251 (+) Transcript_40012:1278-2030(+)
MPGLSPPPPPGHAAAQTTAVSQGMCWQVTEATGSCASSKAHWAPPQRCARHIQSCSAERSPRRTLLAHWVSCCMTWFGRPAIPTTDQSHVSELVTVSAQVLQHLAMLHTSPGPSAMIACRSTVSGTWAQSLLHSNRADAKRRESAEHQVLAKEALPARAEAMFAALCHSMSCKLAGLLTEGPGLPELAPPAPPPVVGEPLAVRWPAPADLGRAVFAGIVDESLPLPLPLRLSVRRWGAAMGGCCAAVGPT